jgi:hypothetical protein
MSGILARAVTVCALLGATTVFLANARRTEVVVPRPAFDTFPRDIGPWRSINEPPMDAQILKVLGVAA